MNTIDPERYQNIIRNIHNISITAKELPDFTEYGSYNERYQQIKLLCSQLWFYVFATHRHGLHDFNRCTTDEVRSDALSIWSITMFASIAGRRKEMEFESVCWNYYEIDTILDGLSKDAAKVYRIYTYILEIESDATCYDDEERTMYAKLLMQCSKIYGECYAIFNDDGATYAIAYLIHKIAEIMFGELYETQKDTWDDATKFICTGGGHFDMYRAYDCCPVYTERIKLLRAALASLHSDNSMQNKVYWFIDMTNMYYEYKWDELLKMVDANNWDRARFDELRAKNKKQHEQQTIMEDDKHKRQRDSYMKELLPNEENNYCV